MWLKTVFVNKLFEIFMRTRLKNHLGWNMSTEDCFTKEKLLKLLKVIEIFICKQIILNI